MHFDSANLLKGSTAAHSAEERMMYSFSSHELIFVVLVQTIFSSFINIVRVKHSIMLCNTMFTVLENPNITKVQYGLLLFNTGCYCCRFFSQTFLVQQSNNWTKPSSANSMRWGTHVSSSSQTLMKDTSSTMQALRLTKTTSSIKAMLKKFAYLYAGETSNFFASKRSDLSLIFIVHLCSQTYSFYLRLLSYGWRSTKQAKE